MGSVFRQKGRKTWMLKYYREGRRIVESSRTEEKREAERLLKLREAAVVEGKRILPRASRYTVDEGMRDVLNDYIANAKRSHDHADRRWRLHLKPVFGGRRMAAVTTADVRSYIAARLEQKAASATINRELALLKRAFSLARKAEIIATSPYIPMLEEDNVRQGFFEDAQIEAVIAHLPESLQGVIRFAAITGWRIPSEVLTLQWRQIDLDGVLSANQQTWGVVRLEPGTTKNRKGRVFPCTPELRDVLLVQKRRAEEHAREHGQIVPWVFHADGEPISQFGFFRTAWDRACKAAGCPGRVPHDLRRTAVRNSVRAGIPDVVAMRLSGHKTRSVFDRYNIVSGDDLAAGVAKLSPSATGSLRNKG